MIIKKITKGSLFRYLFWILTQKKNEYKYRSIFVSAMNKKAKCLGMRNTHYINPSGLAESGRFCLTTARDLCLLTYDAILNERLCKYYAKTHEITRYIPTLFNYKIVRRKKINAKISSTTINGYPIILEKTGGGDGHYALLSAVNMNGNIIVGAIMEAIDEDHRFYAMCELMKGVEDIIKEEKYISNCVCSAKSACAYIVNKKNRSLRCIYEQNPDRIFPTMSTAKLMTVLIALEYVHENDEIWTTPYDIMGTGYGDFLYVWDKISVRDLIYLCLLPSCCVAANILARLAGKKMLNNISLYE